MYSTSQCLHALDTLFHGALRFITNLKTHTHHCLLYSRVEWFSLSIRRWMHWHLFIYKAVLGLLPPYLTAYILPRSAGTYHLRSQDLFLLSVPKARTDFGKKAFNFAAPSAWNQLQNELRLKELVSLYSFKGFLKDLAERQSVCHCF